MTTSSPVPSWDPDARLRRAELRLDLGEARPHRLEVRATGPSATIQDLGRPGLAELGVGRAGAVDEESFRLANRLVGNPESHAAIEATLGGLAVRFTKATVVAITGAPCPLSLPGSPRRHTATMYEPLYMYAGTQLHLGPPSRGVHSYLAVRGGIDVPAELGSRATDTLARLGPPRLTPGAMLPIGEAARTCPSVDPAPGPPTTDPPSYPERPTLRILPGPRDDWFIANALTALCHPDGYEVTAQSNRIGLRLKGPSLYRRLTRELGPEPTVAGALQVPPAGQPVLLLSDQPVSDGHPVIAVAHPGDLPLAAQVRPRQRIRFALDHAEQR